MNYYSRRLEERGLRVVVAPETEPITLEEARLHLRLDAYGSPPGHEDDSLIAALLPAAREYCELYAGRSFAPQTLELTMNEFPVIWRSTSAIELPMAPVISVESVASVDGTLDGTGYSLEAGKLYPALAWPTVTTFPAAIRIRYRAGFSLPGESPQDDPLPARARAAILLVLGDLYENRTATAADQRYELPFGVQSLLGIDSDRRGFA